MNMNELALKICQVEAGKTQLTIAQVKEVLRCLADMFCESDEIVDTWNKYCAFRHSTLRRASGIKLKGGRKKK